MRRFFGLCEEEINAVNYIREFGCFARNDTDEEKEEPQTIPQLMCDNRDYDTKFLIWTIATNYQEQEFFYHHIALRKVWEQYAFHLCKSIYSNG